MRLVSSVERGLYLSDFTEEDIQKEPMFMDATPEFALEQGGPITRDFINTIKEEISFNSLKPVIFDCRVHYVEQGQYPAIPGWHHEDASRVGNKNRRPEYINPQYRSYHVMGMINGDICPTEFALGEVDFELPDSDYVYGIWAPMVDEAIKDGQLQLYRAPSNQLIWFDDRVWHRASSAVKSGWRWWGRMSYSTHRIPTNKIVENYPVY
jgi:hypothetical protein